MNKSFLGYLEIFLEENHRKLCLSLLGKNNIWTQKHIYFGFLVNSHFLTKKIHRSYWLRKEKKGSNWRFIDIINSFLLCDFNKNIGRLSQMLWKHLNKVFLVLSKMNERTVLFEPFFTSLTLISYGDRFCTVEDDGHIFIKVNCIINWFCVKFFFWKQEQREERFYHWNIFHNWNILIPFF